jgi:hypothetical protein
MTATQPQIEPSASPSSASTPDRVRPVAATQVPFLWGQIEPLLAPAILDPLYTTLDLYLDLAGGRATLWLVERAEVLRAAIVTRIHDLPGGRALRVQLSGGEGMRDWRALLPQIEAAARGAGCVRMEIEGRRGLERMFPDFRFQAVRLEKEIA